MSAGRYMQACIKKYNQIICAFLGILISILKQLEDKFVAKKAKYMGHGRERSLSLEKKLCNNACPPGSPPNLKSLSKKFLQTHEQFHMVTRCHCWKLSFRWHVTILGITDILACLCMCAYMRERERAKHNNLSNFNVWGLQYYKLFNFLAMDRHNASPEPQTHWSIITQNLALVSD